METSQMKGKTQYRSARTKYLNIDEILTSYEVLSSLYPYVPSMTLWRSWEYAAYQHYTLEEPVLDIGCGDGQFLKMLWPHLTNVVGIDSDPKVASIAKSSGVYREVHITPAHKLPVSTSSFGSVFANCALEHMDHLPEVLASISKALKPEGTFLCSVVTDKFVEWQPLPLLLKQLGESQRAQIVHNQYLKYQHLLNPFPVEEWEAHLSDAGLEVVEYWPIVPELMSKLFLFLDQLWHVPYGPDGEIGALLYSQFQQLNNFPENFKDIVEAVCKMEPDYHTCSGAVFWTRKIV